MLYRVYETLDDYHYYCYFWGELDHRMNERFHPNPWLFKIAYQPLPEEHYVVVFRNFDSSKEYIVSCTQTNGEFKYSFPAD